MGRKTILLIAALVVAALGTALVFMYANRADERAQAGAAQVQVLVATEGIAAGTTGAAISESATVELRTLPAASVPPGALSDLTPVTELITITTIFPGQVLLEQMFGTQAQTSGALTLPEGKVAVAIVLGDPQRVAGFVNPGSEVAIFRTATPPAAPGAEGEDATTPTPETGVLLDRVQVIAVGPTTVSSTTTTDGQTTNTEAIPTAILTLALDQEQAQKVILSTTDGQMYFALLDENSEIDPQLPPTTTTDLQAQG